MTEDKRDGASGALPDDLSFEVALRRLEEIVRRLESGDVALEESMRLFEEGVAMARHCSTLLSAAESKIELLVQREDGGFRLDEWRDPEQPAKETK